MEELRKNIAGAAKRVVVKLGSAVLAGSAPDGGAGSPDVLAFLAEGIHSAKAEGREMVIVSSGAIAMGMATLGLQKRPKSIPEIQATAAVGQSGLMTRYESVFARHSEKVAQILLTHDDIADRKRFLNARNTLLTLLGLGVIPVINENDTVATEELKFGDNDALAALATNLVEADLLLILTDIDGLHDKNPAFDETAKRIALVENVDRLKPLNFGNETSRLGTGGIVTKIEAARKAAHFGAATIVASGFEPDIIGKALSGEDVGTLFLPMEDRLTSKKHWIAFSTRPTGRVFVDDGARAALLDGKKSLLPSGITRVDGTFEAGEVVHLVDNKGMEFARGITNYSSDEIDSIRGKKSTEIEALLGYRVYDEVVHRDNLVVL